MKVDPNMRCVVMLIYGFKLVVIPFYEEHSGAHQSVANAHHIDKSIEMDMNTSDVTQSASAKSHHTTASTSLSSYTIDLRKLDNWLEVRVIDIEFLYGYYEPTLFILCESNLTWVGRYALKKDTCNSVALSLNLNQKTHPIIWPVEKLPSDCLKCLAVPSPIGGILLFATNSLIYVNQSVPSYGVSLNSIAKLTSNYPLKNMDHIKVALDSCQAAFIAPDRLLISLKGGEIYIVTLLTDSESLRTIRSFNIEKGPGSVIASSIIKCSENYVFIGSRLGNSVLLKYSVKEQKSSNIEKRKLKDLEDDGEENDESTNERELNSEVNETLIKMKNEQMDTFVPANPPPLEQSINEIDDLDIILERNEEKSFDITDVPSYNFEICDILLNVAPCGHSIVGESVGDYSEFETNSLHIDLVTSSGHTKNGAVSVLQRSIRPEVIATFQIPDVIDMWSVYSDSNDSTSSSHTFLFLSKVDSTMVLQMANEITELDKETSIFCTKHPTMCCSNLDDNKYIIQVTSNCIYIYAECTAETSGNQVLAYDLTSQLDSKMKQVSVIDPYVTILTEKGSILFLKFDPTNVLVKVMDNRKILKYEQNEAYFNAVSCFSLYKDESKIFNNQYCLSDDNIEQIKPKLEPVARKTDQFASEITIDDEDELLYGSHTVVNEKSSIDLSSEYISQLLSAPNKAKSDSYQNKIAIEETDSAHASAIPKNATFWLLTVTLDGSLAFMNLKDEEIHLVYIVSKFYSAPKTLVLHNQFRVDQMNNQEPSQISLIKSSSLIDNTQIPSVQEILMISVGHEKSRPLLISRIEEDLIVYEAFIANDSGDVIPQINFKRLNHEIVIRDRKKRKIQNRKNLNSDAVNGEQDIFSKRTRNTPTLTKFESIAGFSGFCITGFHPYLVFFCPRSGLTPHPMWLDGQLGAFVSLKNASITMSGFIYFNKNFDIRICTLPVEDANGKLQIYYDSPWVLKKMRKKVNKTNSIRSSSR